MKFNNNKWFYIVLGGIFIYQLYWIFLGAYFSYPNAEDLSVTVLSRDKGIFEGALLMLQTFDGRYTVNLLHGLNPLAFDAYYANKWVSVFTFLSFWLSIFHFLNVQFKEKHIFINLLFALGCTTLFFSLLNLSQSLYWMICSFVYIYPLILFLNFYTFYLKFKKNQKKINYILSTLFLFFAVGCCELYLPIFGIFLLSLFFKSKTTTIERNVLFWYLIVFSFSSLLFIMSPGIHYRYQYLGQNKSSISLIETVQIAIEYMWISIKFLNYMPVILFIILFNLEYKTPRKGTVNYLAIVNRIIFVLFMWLIIIFLIGNKGFPSRVLPVFVLLYIYILSKLSLEVVLLSRINEKIVAIALISSIMIIPDSYSLIREDYKTGRLKTFKIEMDKQYFQVSKIKVQDTNCIKITEISNVHNFMPKSIASPPYIKLNREDDFWNRAYERYFHIDEIRLNIDTNKKILDKTYEILY